MSAQQPERSRWKHFRASLSRQARGRGKDTIAIVLLTAVAIVMTLWIFAQQKAALPSWAPLVGEDFAHLTADFTSAQAVTAGQGQAVVIAGVKVGKIGSVNLEEGRAVIGLDIEPKYLKLVHPDATLLLRPKTNLNDMTVEIDPGAAPGQMEDGDHFPLSRTEPNVSFEALLSTLDADTQQYLQLLVAGGADGIGGRGAQLSNVFRRFEPFTHHLADLNRVLAERRTAIARSIHYFGLLTQELGRRDNQIERFVTSSKDVLGNFANQQQAIQETLIESPAVLSTLKQALDSSNRLSLAARPALLGLIPQAQALGPALEASGRFFDQTTATIRDQIRPFTRQVRPVVTHTRQLAPPLDRTVRGFGNSLGAFNSFLNQLAYKPKGSRESFLFYLPWFNHNLNATFNLDDTGGPVQRAMAMITCNASVLGYGLADSNPYLKTILEGLRIPRSSELPAIPSDPKEREKAVTKCGPEG